MSFKRDTVDFPRKAKRERLKKYSPERNEPIRRTIKNRTESQEPREDIDELPQASKIRRNTFGYQRPRWDYGDNGNDGGNN